MKHRPLLAFLFLPLGLAACSSYVDVDPVVTTGPASEPIKATPDRQSFYYSLPRTVISTGVTLTLTLSQYSSGIVNSLADDIADQNIPSDDDKRNYQQIWDDSMNFRDAAFKYASEEDKKKPTKPTANDDVVEAAKRNYLAGAQIVYPLVLIEQKDALGGDDYSDHGTTLKVTKPTVTAHSEADPDAVFVIKLDSNGFEDLSLTLKVLETTQLSSVTNTGKNRTVDYAVSTLNFAAGLAGKVVGAGGVNLAMTTPAQAAHPTQPKDVVQAMHDAMAIKVKDALTALNKWRGFRDQLIQSTNNIALDAYKQKLSDMADNITTQLALLGVNKTTDFVANFEVTPKTSGNSFGWSVALSPDGKGASFWTTDAVKLINGPTSPFPITTPTADQIAAFKKPVQLSLTATEIEKQPLSKIPGWSLTSSSKPHAPPVLQKGQGSFIYRLPSSTAIELKLSGKTVFSSPLMVAQFGVFEQLPHSLGGSSHSLQFDVYPDTGALSNLTISSTGYDASATVDKVATGTSSLVDATLKKTDNELTDLQRQEAVLKAQKDIRDLQKSLDTPNP